MPTEAEINAGALMMMASCGNFVSIEQLHALSGPLKDGLLRMVRFTLEGAENQRQQVLTDAASGMIGQRVPPGTVMVTELPVGGGGVPRQYLRFPDGRTAEIDPYQPGLKVKAPKGAVLSLVEHRNGGRPTSDS